MIPSFHYRIQTPLKDFLLLEVNGAISALCSPEDLSMVEKQIQRFAPDNIIFQEGTTPLLLQAEHQLQEYFDGRRQNFELSIMLYGTPFQSRVWQQLSTIPYGKTCSYGDIAHALSQKGAQAVGTAVGKNPLPIIVPCHRVLPANGTLGQFSMQGGPSSKAFLLDLEKAVYKH